MIDLYYICLTFINYMNIKPKNLMKKNLTFFALATMMLLGISSVFCACSSDDDDNGNQQKAGDEAVAKLRNLVLDESGNVVFGETETAGLYEIGFGEKSDAVSLVAKYLNNANYKGGNSVYELVDNRGKVSVTEGQEDGVFYQMEFAVKGIPAMTLLIEETNYMMGKDNTTTFTAEFKCPSCSYSIRKAKSATPGKCPNDGSKLVKQ